MREIAHVHQRPGEPRRRWFQGSGADLYVWLDDAGAIVAFEFCYAQGRDERAAVWKAERGVAHFRVDDGESSALANSSPVLARGQAKDGEAARACFAATAQGLPEDVAGFVLDRLV